MKQKTQSAVCSSKGNVRGNNEDNFYMNGVYMPLAQMDNGAELSGESQALYQLYAVCDGMGGEDAGELASFTVVEMLGELQQAIENREPIRTAIDHTVQETNSAVCALNRGAGCTLAMLCLHEGKATVAWLGDSRIYLFRQGRLFRLIEDHTQSQRLINLGVLDESAAKAHGMKNVLTRYLGMEMEDIVLQPAYGEEITLKKGDVFFLCSDGLTDMVAEEDMGEYFEGNPQQAARSLVDAALKNGGRDNVTALVVEIQECKRGWMGLRC